MFLIWGKKMKVSKKIINKYDSNEIKYEEKGFNVKKYSPKIDENILKPIESEKEFWIKNKEYNKKMSKAFKNWKGWLKSPVSMVENIDTLLEEMLFIGLYSDKEIMEQRERLYKELNSPLEFKNWISEHRDNFKQKMINSVKKFNFLK